MLLFPDTDLGDNIKLKKTERSNVQLCFLIWAGWNSGFSFTKEMAKAFYYTVFMAFGSWCDSA